MDDATVRVIRTRSVTAGPILSLLSPQMLHADDRDTGAVWRGRLLHIHIAPVKSVRMEEQEHARLITGRGIEGDRYFFGTGTYSPKPDVREVTLFEIEVLEALARNDPPLQAGAILIEPGDHRRNLTVRGVPLGHLVGKRFRIGDVVLSGGRLNFPCKYLEKLLERPVYLPLYNRSGLNCRIEQGGTIRRGDVIEPLGD
jgi:MOSC domain-containing protein YiiM